MLALGVSGLVLALSEAAWGQTAAPTKVPQAPRPGRGVPTPAVAAPAPPAPTPPVTAPATMAPSTIAPSEMTAPPSAAVPVAPGGLSLDQAVQLTLARNDTAPAPACGRRSGETGGLAEDLHHFELLSNILLCRFWGQNLANSGQFVDSSASGLLSLPSSLAFADVLADRGRERIDPEIDPEELIDRADLASAIRKAGGEPELAAAELGKILILEP